jgi:membrane protease YdiL (CAAX protease family)
MTVDQPRDDGSLSQAPDPSAPEGGPVDRAPEQAQPEQPQPEQAQPEQPQPAPAPPGFGGSSAPGWTSPPGWQPGAPYTHGLPVYPGLAPGYGWPPPTQPGWTPPVPPSLPTYPGLASGWSPPAGGPGWAYPPGAPAPGWGYPAGPWSYPYPAWPAVMQPPRGPAPGKLHPVVPPRRLTSTAGRAAPRAYAAAWLLGVPGAVYVVAILAAAQSGLLQNMGVAGSAALEAAFLAIAAGFICGAIAQTEQRRADGWQDYFGPSPMLLIGAWLPLTFASTLALEVLLGALELKLPDTVWTLVGVLLNLAVFVALIQATVVRPGALTWTDMARPKRLASDPADFSFSWSTLQWTTGAERRGGAATFGDMALGAGLGAPLMIATLIYTYVLALILGLRDVEVPPGPVPTSLPGWDLWIILVAAAVVAPIGEEVFFRGLATNVWARSLTRSAAIWRAAFVFASIHIINIAGPYSDASVLLRLAVLAVAARIPVAWALSWVYTRRRSIYSSIALHATYNGCLVLLVWWVSQTTSY